jgi:cellulose synthase operon protein C
MRRLFPVLVLVLCACAHAPPAPTAVLDDAAGRAKDTAAPSRTVALAGFHALLVENQPERARSLSDEALRRDPGEPYALMLQDVLARRDGHPEAALDAALRLVRAAPKHPLATVAAREIQELAGLAGSLDARILSEAPQALAAGADGETAVLLRSALAQLQFLDDRPELAETRAAAGVPSEGTLLGPLAALHLLGFSERTEPERSGAVPDSFTGPFGPVTPRVLAMPGGRLSLETEGLAGDVYVLAVDVEVPKAGLYVVRSVSPSTHRMLLDGALLYERRTYERPGSTVAARGLPLEAGMHRLMAVLLKEERSGSLGFTLSRADGQPSGVRFSAAHGPAPRWAGTKVEDAPGFTPDAASLELALEKEAGRSLATFLAARDAQTRDVDGARRLLADLGPLPQAAAWNVLSADLALRDRSLPTKVGQGRATRDLEVAVERDPRNVGALLSRGLLAVNDQRVDQAVALAARARTAHSPVGTPLLGLEARIAMAQGVDAQADTLSRQSLEQTPGLCEALQLRYDVARRRDAVATTDGLLDSMATCPGEQLRRVTHWKLRGQLDRALADLRRLRSRQPGDISLGTQEADLLVSLQRTDEAAALLRGLTALRPRDPGLWKRLGDVLAIGKHDAQALAARERALTLDGSDLSLRRMVERARTGKEILAAFAIEGRAALKAFDARGANVDGSSVLVVDAAATQAFADGSMVDRIHTVEKVLDQSAVARVAEVQVPQGAQVLALRTLKADGTVLEPESLDKDTVSLPGVGVGDAVEAEYLLAHPSRRAASPGWTAGAFYFQVGGVADDWATYAVTAPRGSGMSVDAHNMRTPEIRTEGSQDVLRMEVRGAPAMVPEPNSPPSGTEQLPFVVVGSGDTGPDGLLTATGDALSSRAQRTFEVEAFARTAAAGKTGVEAVRALHAAVMERIPGRDSGLGLTAAATLAQDRGSRLWLLKAALEAQGFPARLAMVRTFAADPNSYRFPNEALFPYACLRVEVPGQAPVWLDTVIRFGPFGLLPEQAASGREAYLLPEPGRPLVALKTPQQPPVGGREVSLQLTLAEDGTLSGDVLEVYKGFEAAQLAETLEGVSNDQRDQALQQALSRYFGGAQLSNLRLDIKRAVGASVSLRYHFVAPRFARVDDDRLTLGPLTYPAQIGRRYVTLGTRRSPLFIDSTELNTSHVALRLPPGWTIDDPLKAAKLESPFGLYARDEQQTDLFRVEERYRLDMARIPVKQYEAFAGFAGQVDLLQTRDLVAIKPGALKNPAGRTAR